MDCNPDALAGFSPSNCWSVGLESVKETAFGWRGGGAITRNWPGNVVESGMQKIPAKTRSNCANTICVIKPDTQKK